MTGAHVFYIPMVLFVGVVLGFVLKSQLTKDARAEPRKRTRITDE
jgi:hypothetical protein